MSNLPQLPLDVLLTILSHLPPVKSRGNRSARAIARFSTCSKLFNDAASVASIWESHYAVRFTVSDASKEEERAARFGDDWRLRYAERMRIEKVAEAAVRRLSEDRKSRRRCIKEICDLGLDIWDFLTLNADLPYPPSFGYSEWDPEDGVVPDRPMSWKHWCSVVKRTVTQGHTIREVARLKDCEGTEDKVSFTDAMDLMAGFVGSPPSVPKALVASLAESCRNYLVERSCLIDPSDPQYDETVVCTEIARFMRAQGFNVARSSTFREVAQNFPNLFLQEGCRETIPISLVYVFVNLARYCGLDAGSTNSPNVVLGRVETARYPPENFVLVNPLAINFEDLQDLLMLPPFDDLPHGIVNCASASEMLQRSSRNIVAALRESHPDSMVLAHSALCAAIAIDLLLAEDEFNATKLLATASQLMPMECYTLSAVLGPLLEERRRRPLEEYCRKGLAMEDRYAYTVYPKSRRDENVKYFVGMVVRSRKFEIPAVIIGWDDQWYEESYEQLPSEARSLPPMHSGFGIQNQPYYHVMTTEGALEYLPENDLQIIPLTSELVSAFVAGTDQAIFRCFSDVQLSTPSSDRGIFKLSAELSDEYPEDEWYGARWVKAGREEAREQAAALEAFTQEFRDLL